MSVEPGSSRVNRAGPSCPLLTANLPGIGGVIKDRPEDFVVEELPLYGPSGAGEYTFFEIRKVGLSTFQAVHAIAQALHVPPSRISYAGLKDAQATACQILSVHAVAPDTVTALSLPGIHVLWAERHPRKLKIGHLRGNRFTVRVRQVSEDAVARCRAILDVLARRGVPNRFGEQRFGMRGDSARLGRALVHQQWREFIDALLGHPDPADGDVARAARTHFDAGHWPEALSLLPAWMPEERRALQQIIQSGGDYTRAASAVSVRLKTFLVSAYQSDLFNRILDARLHSLDRLFPGDVAVKHPGHSLFRVEDAAAEQPRADRFEISPTGPIFGSKMMTAGGVQGDLEAEALAAEGLTPDSFRLAHGIRARGERRSLRFPVHDPELWYDDGLVLRFWLPRGCYATTVLAEIMKTPPQLRTANVRDVTEL